MLAVACESAGDVAPRVGTARAAYNITPAASTAADDRASPRASGVAAGQRPQPAARSEPPSGNSMAESYAKGHIMNRLLYA